MHKYERSEMDELYLEIIKELPEVAAMNRCYYLAMANTVKFIEDCLDMFEKSGHEEIKIKDLKSMFKKSIIDSHAEIGGYYSKLQKGVSEKGEFDYFKDTKAFHEKLIT